MSERTYFYVAVGAQLTVHDLDSEQARLRPGATVTAPVPIHYVWCHPAEPLLYVVCSNGGPKGRRGERHVACSFRIDPANGELSPFGPSVELAARPIHCTVDSQGSYLLIAYNIPSALSAHPIAPDGSIAPAVQQAQDLDTGVFAHQVRMTPSNRSAVLVTRGNDAAGAQAEDPGALKVYGMEHGQLNLAASIAPGDGTGLGFGPRHLDFHPNGRWMYVSVERQNELQLYTLDANDNISAQPTFICDSLADRSKPRGTQIASAVHVHPNGRFVYQANRTDQLTDSEGWQVAQGGEDSMVVYSIDTDTGEPKPLQHIDTGTRHVRTFSIHPSGNLLIAASIAPVPQQEADGSIALVPAALLVYRIGEDGRLALQRRYDIDTEGSTMFWSGMVTAG